jgi:hypothetical protein
VPHTIPVLIARVQRWLRAMKAANPEADEAEAQRYWRKRLAEHPDERTQARPGQAQVGRTVDSSRRRSWPRSTSQALSLLTGCGSILLYVPGGCLLGYGVGPGHSVVLIAIGAVLIAVGIPLRFAAQSWRRGALRGRRLG